MECKFTYSNHPTSSAAKCVVVLRLVVNIINDCCCSIQNYNAAIWWTTVAKLGSSFEPPEPPGYGPVYCLYIAHYLWETTASYQPHLLGSSAHEIHYFGSYRYLSTVPARNFIASSSYVISAWAASTIVNRHICLEPSVNFYLVRSNTLPLGTGIYQPQLPETSVHVTLL